MAMKQVDLFAAPTPARPDDTADGAERDLFGDPITAPAVFPTPTYRPRKPVQQALALTPGTFTLT